MATERYYRRGFTLIELSIVLIIIGLIIGGILVGQDLISAAAVRAKISQIEKYNTAVYTFQGKYGYLPGDMPDPYATQFGFLPRGTMPAQGDGNGIVQSLCCGNQPTGLLVEGEIAVFRVDLSTANLIDGKFNTATPAGTSLSSVAQVALWLPAAKIGQGNYITIWGGDITETSFFSDSNYFSVEAFSPSPGYTTGMTVQQAYAIDKKMDDGLPQTGNVKAGYDAGARCYWSAGAAGNCLSSGVYPGFNASPTTCIDNRNVTSGTMYYSISQSSNGLNCALSFRFQ